MDQVNCFSSKLEHSKCQLSISMFVCSTSRPSLGIHSMQNAYRMYDRQYIANAVAITVKEYIACCAQDKQH